MKNLKIALLLTISLSCYYIRSSAQESTIIKMSVEDLFTFADRNSKSLKSYEIAISQAAQGIKTAKNIMMPSIDLSLSASYLGNLWLSDRDFKNGTNIEMPHFGNNFAIEASQVIYAGGAILNEIELAKLQHQSALLDKELTRQDIRFLLVGNYLELYKLSNEIEVYKKNIEQTRLLLANIKAKESEGLALKNDITRFELKLQSLELDLTHIENSKIITNNRIVTILDLQEGTTIEVDTTIINSLPSQETEIYWQNTATDIAPSIKQSQLLIEQSKRREKFLRAERIPSISFIAGDKFDGPITIEVPTIDKNINYWYLGVGIKYNLASAYKTGRVLKQAQFSTQRAKEQHELMQDNIKLNVKDAYIRYVESFTVYDNKVKSFELATQNYTVVNNRYLNDLALITDMLDADNSKLSAELQVVNAKVNILFNYYRLKNASGNL